MKSKQSIRILIVLMSIALLGVIIIQFLWIKNAMELKQEQFTHGVNAALIRVSADLENQYGVHWITEKLESDSSALKEVMSQDPGFYRFMISGDDTDININTNESNDQVVTTTTTYNTVNRYAGSGDNGCLQNRIITVVNVGHNKRPVVIEKGVWEEPPPMPTPHTPVKPPKGSRLVSIVKSAADEWALSKMNVKDVSTAVDSVEILAALKKEFKRQGLPANFVFATYCTTGDTLMINKTASTNPLKDFAFNAPLLSTDFIDQSSLLLVNFPQHYQYLFASVAGMLLLSLIFTVSIIATFGYSLHVIFKQKKVSDITNDFINNMTHELKTPLATISMAADTLALASVNQKTELVNEYSGAIKSEVKKLALHVDKILEAALLEKNGADAQHEPVNMNQLIADVVKVFQPLVQQRNGNITAHIPDGIITVSGNRQLLQSAVSNLIDNALKYSKDIPEINVVMQQVAGKMQLVVKDQGIGISKADQTLVFEKFYRAHTGNRHDVKGFGLGLSFVKDVVENMAGKVGIESELGKGSSFLIEIPVA